MNIQNFAIVNVKLKDVPNDPPINHQNEFAKPRCRLKENVLNPIQNSKNYQLQLSITHLMTKRTFEQIQLSQSIFYIS